MLCGMLGADISRSLVWVHLGTCEGGGRFTFGNVMCGR